LLELCDAVVARGGVLAVRSASLAVPAGSWFGLIGANGSGKTSLLRAMAGRLPFESGRLVLKQEDVTADRARRAALIGFAPEASMLPVALTGRDLLRLVAGHFELGFEALGSLRDVLAIEPLLDRPVGTLSSGMRQRLALACAFAPGKDILLLDEPFNWLDPIVAYDLRIALRDRVEAGLTLVTALHDLGTLASACDTGAVLADGRISLALDREALALAARDPAAFERRTIDFLRPRLSPT
jgi:ABC-type multidrug transport system ATPase subunit